MSGQHAGYRAELRVKDVLEKQGWYVIRSAASKKVDLVATKGGKTMLVEVKFTSAEKPGTYKAPRGLLAQVHMSYGVTCVLCIVLGGRRGMIWTEVGGLADISMPELTTSKLADEWWQRNGVVARIKPQKENVKSPKQLPLFMICEGVPENE